MKTVIQLYAIVVRDKTFSGHDVRSNCKNEARSVLYLIYINLKRPTCINIMYHHYYYYIQDLRTVSTSMISYQTDETLPSINLISKTFHKTIPQPCLPQYFWSPLMMHHHLE